MLINGFIFQVIYLIFATALLNGELPI